MSRILLKTWKTQVTRTYWHTIDIEKNPRQPAQFEKQQTTTYQNVTWSFQNLPKKQLLTS